MLGLYRMVFDCGRNGELESLFIADDSAVQRAIGQEVYFGEVLGKHSEIAGPLQEDEVVLVTDDPLYVALTLRQFGGYEICGLNPLKHIDNDEEEEESPQELKALQTAIQNFEAKYGKDLTEIAAEFENADAGSITLEMALDWLEWKRKLNLHAFYWERIHESIDEDASYQEKYGKSFEKFSFDFQLMEEPSNELKEDYYNWLYVTKFLLLFKDFISQP